MHSLWRVDADEANCFGVFSNCDGQGVSVGDMRDGSDNATTRIRRDAGGSARCEGETNAHDDRSCCARRSALLFLDALDESAGTETATAAH